MLANQIPKPFCIPKLSIILKNMERGDAKTSVFVYKDEYDKQYSAGLVTWRDRNIVYCMMNDCNTSQYDDCT